MVIAVYGYLMFPDTPDTTTSWFFTEEERALCVSRLPPNTKTVLTWSSFKATVKRGVVGWRLWAFSSLFMVSAMMEAYGIFSVRKFFAFWSTRLSRASLTDACQRRATQVMPLWMKVRLPAVYPRTACRMLIAQSLYPCPPADRPQARRNDLLHDRADQLLAHGHHRCVPLPTALRVASRPQA